MLTAIHKKILIQHINNQYVNVEELPSYRRIEPSDQNFARFNEPGEEDWSFHEEYVEQGRKLIEEIEEYGLWEVTDLPDELKAEAIEFINKETGAV